MSQPFAYLDTEGDQSTATRISDISDGKGQFFDHVRQAAAEWDSTDPIHGCRRRPSDAAPCRRPSGCPQPRCHPAETVGAPR
jgi:hypothetical protein